MTSIAVIGSIHVDFVIRVPRLPLKGETIIGEDFNIYPGGKGANQCLGVARLGAKAYMIGRVGDDFLADIALRNLRAEENIVLDYVKTTKNVHTGTAFILVDLQGENIIAVAPGADKHLSPRDVDEFIESVNNFNVLLTQLEIPLSTVLHALMRASRIGALTILNPAPAKKIPEEAYKYIDVLTPNKVELETLTGMRVKSINDVVKASKLLLEKGVKIAVITTLGAQGVLVTTKDTSTHIPALKVKVVDTTGAGDAFNAGLAVALAEGKDIVSASKWANTVAALKVTKMGAQEGLPRRNEVENLLLKS